MSKKEMKTEIAEDICTGEEILGFKFTDAYLNRQVRLHELGEIYLFARLGLIKNSFLCQSCENPMRLTQKKKVIDKYVWRCKRPCAQERSLRTNSIFESLKVSMSRYFKFMTMWCRNGLQVDIAHDTDVNKNTLSAWSFGLRETIKDYLIENREMLGGYDENGASKIVEIDESCFFRRKYNRGRYTEASWVFGMLERGSRKCAFIPVPDRSASTLLPLIRANCLPGTTIISDCWASYRSLSADPNFTHLRVNHSLNFVSPDNPIVHTQNIENSWMHSKKAIRNQQGGSRNNLEGYLYEFMFKKKFPRNSRINELILILSNMLE